MISKNQNYNYKNKKLLQYNLLNSLFINKVMLKIAVLNNNNSNNNNSNNNNNLKMLYNMFLLIQYQIKLDILLKLEGIYLKR
jgi:hypothetical protein